MKVRKKAHPADSTLDGSKPVLVRVVIDYHTKYCCPFCGYEGRIYEFRVPVKKGMSEKRAVCPDCGVVMRMKTLCMEITAKEWAEFLYDYLRFDGWKRVSWDKLKMRLKSMGLASTFWTAWYEAKAKAQRERYGYSESDEERMYQDYSAQG